MAENNKDILSRAREEFEKIIDENNLRGGPIRISFRTLTPRQAIGEPLRKDYPIIKGVEKVIEAVFDGAKAQVFTDSPADFTGTVDDIMNLKLDSNSNRAIFTAAINAVLARLSLIENTIHCKDEEPERCAEKIAGHILEKYGRPIIGLIGLNPAILEKLVEVFGPGNIRATDRSAENIGTDRFGLRIADGYSKTAALITQSQLLLVTGTTIINGSLDEIAEEAKKQSKKYILYGVSAAGVAHLLGLERLCFPGDG